MPRARNRLLELALVEAHRELEELEVKHEKLARANAALRSRMKTLEARVLGLESELAKYRPPTLEDRP